MINIIVLVGESASGKSSIEKEMTNRGYKRVISYTSRPRRENEVDGIDYHYITKEEFKVKIKEGFFAEHTCYRDWLYGSSKQDCTNDKIIVTNPHGLRQLRKLPEINITAFYIKTDERTRFIRMLKRGDEIFECIRRIFSDQGVFQNIEEDCDHVIDGEESVIESVVSIIGADNERVLYE